MNNTGAFEHSSHGHEIEYYVGQTIAPDMNKVRGHEVKAHQSRADGKLATAIIHDIKAARIEGKAQEVAERMRLHFILDVDFAHEMAIEMRELMDESVIYRKLGELQAALMVMGSLPFGEEPYPYKTWSNVLKDQAVTKADEYRAKHEHKLVD